MQALYVNALIQENTEIQFSGRHKVRFLVQCCGFATPLAHELVTFSDALSYSRKGPSHYGGGITDSGGCGVLQIGSDEREDDAKLIEGD